MMISAKQVQDLRERTGAGIMDCKKALSEVGGNLEAAINYLRQQGSVKAAKRVHRATSEGLVGYHLKGNVVGIVELSCETDFVARTDKFIEMASALAEQVAVNLPKDMNDLKNSSFIGDKNQKVEDALTSLIASTGENIAIKRFNVVKASNGEKIGGYVHPGSKIGVAVRLSGKVDDNFVKDVAMHVAAMNPSYLDPSDIPSEIVEKEKAVFKGMDDLKDKPENIAEKIISGRLEKWKKEISLLDQIFIKDPTGKMTIRAFLQKGGPDLKIREFVRFQVGEEG